MFGVWLVSDSHAPAEPGHSGSGKVAVMVRHADQTGTALLVIDVQTAVIANAPDRDAVLANINTLVDAARAADTPVIWVQHNDDDMPHGSDGWEIDAELSPDESDPVVHKQMRSSFENTNLDAVLAEHGIGHLVVVGAQTDFCVRWTLHGALERGYDTTLVADAHGTDDPPTDAYPSASQTVTLLNSVWASQETSGPNTSVVPTAEVVFAVRTGN